MFRIQILQKKCIPSECNVNGRPMLPQTMEFITDMGTIFQSCMKDEISVDEFCEKAQGLVEKYSK